MDVKDLTSCKEEKNGDIRKKWLSWCRLCAKRELDDQESLSLFVKNKTRKMGTELATSIGKYFWVNIKADDDISQCLCLQCNQLIEELVAFTERVNKVQTLYCLLQNIKPTTTDQVDKLRSQCGLVDEGWQHIIKPEPPLSKTLLNDKEIQTDLLSFMENENDQLHTDNQIAAEREEIINILQKPDKSEDDYESQTETIASHVYEFVIQGENGEEIVNNEYIPPASSNVDNQAVEHNIVKAIDDVQDSDLFKELKYKIVDDEEEEEDEDQQKETKFEIFSEVKEVEVKSEDSSQPVQQGEDEEMEHTIEMLEDYEENEEDYVNISETLKANEIIAASDELPKGKRGRPFGSKNLPSEESPYRFECDACKRIYKNAKIFRKHMSAMHNVIVDNLPEFRSANNTCTICSKQFLTRSTLKIHLKHHLPDEEKYNVPCPYCDRKFSQVGAMRQHVNGIHHQMKPYICDQCGRACKTMAALTEHQLVHTTECPFECEVCHKRFKNKPRLKSHMDTHNISVYKCSDCGLELNTKRTLLQHRLVHSDEKRFKCEFCDAAFKRSKALKNHLILHSGLRPYKCNFCNKSFSNGSNCRAHKKRAHPRELAEEEATGKEKERVPIPRLEELKSAKGVLVQPRKVKRHAGGLPNHLRKLLKSSEQRKQENSNDSEDDANIYKSYSDLQYEICRSENEETESLIDNPSEECEETVIYEIIDEI